MPSLRATSCADALLPLEYSTTDSACCPCVSALVVLPRLKPACSTLSAVVAARPVTVVPLSTATVIDLGLSPAVLWLFLDFELPPPLLLPEFWDRLALLLSPPPLLVSLETPYAPPAPITR